MPRRLLALVTAAFLLVGTAVAASPASAAYVPIIDNRYQDAFYSVPYAPTLYWSQPLPGGGFLLDVATPAQWASQGFPAPRPAAVRYEKVPWSSTIVAALTIQGWPSTSDTHPLTYAEWASVGFPTPRVTLTPGGIYYRSYKNSPIINAFYGGEVHALTPSEWQASGYPRDWQENLLPGTEIIQWRSSPELFMRVSGTTHKLTPAEWAYYGYPAPTPWDTGFYKLTWDPTIARLSNGSVEILTPATWAQQDYPTPLALPVLPGDNYCYDAARDVVQYDGSTFDGEFAGALAPQRFGVDPASMWPCLAG